jgi:hypothetical protein
MSDEQNRQPSVRSTLSREFAFLGATCGLLMTVVTLLQYSWLQIVFVFYFTPLGGVLGSFLGKLVSFQRRSIVVVPTLLLLVVTAGLVPFRIHAIRSVVNNDLAFSPDFRLTTIREIAIGLDDCPGADLGYQTLLSGAEQKELLKSRLIPKGWELLPTVISSPDLSPENYIYFYRSPYFIMGNVTEKKHLRLRLYRENSYCNYSGNLRKSARDRDNN